MTRPPSGSGCCPSCSTLAPGRPGRRGHLLPAHGGGPVLLPGAPVAATAAFKDSPALNRTTLREIGTWSAAPAATAVRLAALADLRVWLGLKNSDDQGTYFDVRAELLKNGMVIASGEVKAIQGVTRNPDKAKEVVVPFGYDRRRPASKPVTCYHSGS